MAVSTRAASQNRVIRQRQTVVELLTLYIIAAVVIMLLIYIFWTWVGSQFGEEFQVPSLLLMTHGALFATGMFIRGQVDIAPMKTIINTTLQGAKTANHDGAMESRQERREADIAHRNAIAAKEAATKAQLETERNIERVKAEFEEAQRKSKRGRKRSKIDLGEIKGKEGAF